MVEACMVWCTPLRVQKTLARVKERSDAGNFNYNKFFAIGLFRLLEVIYARKPLTAAENPGAKQAISKPR